MCNVRILLIAEVPSESIQAELLAVSTGLNLLFQLVGYGCLVRPSWESSFSIKILHKKLSVKFLYQIFELARLKDRMLK